MGAALQLVTFSDIKQMAEQGMKLSDMAEATGCGREELLYTAICGYIETESMRSMEKILGVPREKIRNFVLERGIENPRQGPKHRKETAPMAGWTRYAPGETVKEWRYNPGEGLQAIPMRAVAVRQYRKFVQCDVLAFSDGIWRFLYRECFWTYLL